MAEGRGMDVEGDAHRIRGLLALQSQEGGQKPKNGVGIQSVSGRKRPNAIEGPIDDGVAVDDHEFHGDTSGKSFHRF